MKLMDYYQDFYKDSPEVQTLQQAFTQEGERLLAAREDSVQQLDIRTATWGLNFWENAYGIATDISKEVDFRRSVVLSKIRGQGTATKQMIENLAASFSNGQVEIIEYPSQGYFDVVFVGTVGVPPNMDDLSKSINEVKPAHLEFEYIYIYVMHEELKTFRHLDLGAYTHEQIRNGGPLKNGR